MQNWVTACHDRWQLYDHNAQQRQQHDASKKRKKIENVLIYESVYISFMFQRILKMLKLIYIYECPYLVVVMQLQIFAKGE